MRGRGGGNRPGRLGHRTAQPDPAGEGVPRRSDGVRRTGRGRHPLLRHQGRCAVLFLDRCAIPGPGGGVDRRRLPGAGWGWFARLLRRRQRRSLQRGLSRLRSERGRGGSLDRPGQAGVVLQSRTGTVGRGSVGRRDRGHLHHGRGGRGTGLQPGGSTGRAAHADLLRHLLGDAAGRRRGRLDHLREPTTTRLGGPRHRGVDGDPDRPRATTLAVTVLDSVSAGWTRPPPYSRPRHADRAGAVEPSVSGPGSHRPPGSTPR